MKKQIKDQNKLPLDRGKVGKKNDFAVDYKSGDFERALKMHGNYLFGKQKSGDDFSLDLQAGETWQAVLDAHAYIEEPSDREIELFQIIQKEIEGKKSRTIDFSLIHTDPAIDAGVLLICFEILVRHGQPGDALNLIFDAKSSKMHSQFSKYVLSKRISPKLLDSLSDEIKRRIDLIKVDLATPKDLSAIAKHAETLVEIASQKLKPEILALLIAMESRIANDGSKLIQKGLAKNCFSVVEKNERYWDKAFQIISELNQLGLLASFIGRREKYLPTNVSRQLEMIKTAANLKLDKLVENEKSWNGLNIGHFARVGTLVKKSDFIVDYLTTARKLTSDALQRLSLGGFLQIVDLFPEFKNVYADEVLQKQIMEAAGNKRGLSSKIIKDLSSELVSDAVALTRDHGNSQLAKSEGEIASLNARLSERGIELDLLVKEIETLKERLRNAGKSELIARSDQLRQAQLQALRGLCELFEEVRIHIAAQDTQLAKSGVILSENGLRILKNFGISMLGGESERLKIDHNLFNVTGSSSMTDGLVVTPAYFVNLESGVEVLIRGTMIVS